MNWRLSVEPRAWQRAALEEWKKALRGVVSVVTGAGKTVFAELCIVEFLHRCPFGRVIIIVPTTALLDQWYVSLREDLGIRRCEIATYSGDGRSLTPGVVNIFVINTARDWVDRVAGNAPSFLIVDECHRAGSEVNRLALRRKHLAALGLSATPVREYDAGFEEYVAPALGPIIFEYDYQAAYADGIVAPFELINVRTHLLPHEEKRYADLTTQIARLANRLRKTGGSPDALKRLLQRRAMVAASAAMRIPVAAKLVESNRGRRSIVFHERIKGAEAICSILKERGTNAATYHTGVGESIRRENLRLFRKGVFECLVTCRALDEGTNVPDTSLGVIASSTRSRRQRIQRLGRVLRAAPGKTHSTIYTIYATPVEENQLAKEAQALQNIVDVKWLTGTVDRNG
jgi:superfamily II DNA or RNA helicase